MEEINKRRTQRNVAESGSRIGRGKEMLIKITGKQKALEDLEKAEKLIKEAQDILWKLPSAIGLELVEGNQLATDSVQDSQ